MKISTAFDQYYYDLTLNGFEDDMIIDTDDTAISVFKITADDRALFSNDRHVLLWEDSPLFTFDPDDRYVLLWEDSQGFIYTQVITESDYESLVASIAADYESMESE